MAVTRLERKGRKNKNVAKKRVNTMKRLSTKPVIKNVDVEAIKAEFESGAAKPAKAKKTKAPKAKATEPVEEVKAEVEEVKAEATEESKAPEAEATTEEAPASEEEKTEE